MVKREQVVINTLVFLEELEKGTPQSDFFKPVNDLGIKKIEVRREYIRQNEWNVLGEIKALTGMEVFYSIPDMLFEKGHLRAEALSHYLSEANRIGATYVKFNRGNFTGWSEKDKKNFLSIVHSFKGVITIENDQTLENGRVDPLVSCLSQTKKVDIPLYGTFDIGNVYWVDEKPLEAAKKLAPFTKFIHLKDVNQTKAGPVVSLLDEGIIKWRHVINQFDASLPVAIEYPCGPHPIAQLKIELEKLRLTT